MSLALDIEHGTDTVEISQLTEADGPDSPAERAWEAFIAAEPRAEFFHRPGWRRVLRRAYGHDPYFRVARRGGAVVGVLPLLHVRSRLFGNALISTGFCVYGGILAADDAAARALAEDAAALGEALGVDYVELRHSTPNEAIGWTAKPDLYATFRKALPDDPADILLGMAEHKRSDLKKSLKSGVRIRADASVDEFYPIYAESVRNHGTPVFGKGFYQAVVAEFGDAVDIQLVEGPDGPVATVMSYFFKDQCLVYWAGSRPAARALHADDCKYWTLMLRARQRGARVFDFGRSKRGTGPFEYKTHWGFAPEWLHYQYHLVKAKEVPDVNPLNPKYHLMVEGWKRLPLGLANRLGPPIARQLG